MRSRSVARRIYPSVVLGATSVYWFIPVTPGVMMTRPLVATRGDRASGVSPVSPCRRGGRGARLPARRRVRSATRPRGRPPHVPAGARSLTGIVQRAARRRQRSERKWQLMSGRNEMALISVARPDLQCNSSLFVSL